MKKRIILLIVLLLMITSCSKDNEYENPCWREISFRDVSLYVSGEIENISFNMNDEFYKEIEACCTKVKSNAITCIELKSPNGVGRRK